MKSIQTKIVLVITSIMVIVAFIFGFTSLERTNRILDEDSNRILELTADQTYRDIEDILSSVEQSVGTIYNYAEKRAESYSNFTEDEEQRKAFTYDISELGKSIAENTRGAMSVYLRYDPERFGSTEGFWYTINIEDGSWDSAEPTDIGIYDKDDVEHVGWYYIPVESGKPTWMDPYYNQNMGIDMISYIIPYTHNGTVVGVIGMDIDIKLLRDFVADIHLYNSGRAYLISQQGDIIFHFDYPEGVRSKDLDDRLMVFINSALNSELDEVHTLTGIDNIERKLISKRLRNGMILGLNSPVDEINIPRSTLTRQLIAISIIILVMAIIVSLTWIRTIIAPLKRMTQAAEHYANGDYSDVMNTDSADEIGILSRSLQTMSDSLKNQIEIADAANRSKSTFLANMSHEIRTPISAMLGFDEMILRETDDPNIRNYASNIKASGKTLLTLINEILDFSKIESGKMEIIPVEYNTVQLINDVLDMIEFRAREKGLELNCDIDKRLPKRMFGDDIRVREILTNLMTNAVKYTNKGSITLTITRLSGDDEKVKIHVSVSDTGIGIKEEDREHLGDKFTRFDNLLNRSVEGTGLGLPITRKYIELMGGSLGIDSKYGKGSDFYFDLVQGVRDPEQIGDFNQARRAAREEVEVYSEGFEAPDAKLLVVDDIELNIAVFKGLIKNSNMNIDSATSGKEAIEKMYENEYDIVFMDHMMPGMDGVEALNRIRNDGKVLSKNVPVIVLTANAISGASQQYLDIGFQDYMSKPIDADLLEKLLIKYLPREKVISKKKARKVTASAEGKTITDATKASSTSSEAGSGGTRLVDKAKGLESCDGREEVYQIAADMFVKEDYAGKLTRAYDEGNWKDYQIHVHGVKSSSKIVGAMSLNELALNAEQSLKDRAAAGSEGDEGTEFVRANHARILDMIAEVKKELTES